MSKLKPIGNSLIGMILSKLYGKVVEIRNRRFDRNPPKPLPFPIISVGGISAGGTGKTPLTALIIEHCIAQGKTPILFSRGYGRVSKETVIVSADGTIPSWETVGDEPAMLRNRFPQLWLAIDGNRMRAAERIMENLPQNAVGIMDDGFQHRKMHRDLNIVTLPATIGSDHVIPAGLLREPLQSLKRADCIVFTGEPDEQSRRIIAELAAETPCGTTSTKPESLHHFQTGEQIQYINCDVTLISGIARPERFSETVKPFFKTIKSHIKFPDHHVYSARDLELFTEDTSTTFCTTEKDMVRLRTKISAKVNNLYYLSITQRFIDTRFRDRFFDLINRHLEHK